MSKVLFQAGKKYLESGLSIVVNNANKRPFHEWKKYETQQMTLPELDNLVNHNEAYGIGIACGFGNIEAIDFDLKHVAPDSSLMKDYAGAVEQRAPGLIKRMRVHKTKNGGYHFIYRCTVVEGNQKLASNINNETLIETRGSGGQIAAPPTPDYLFVPNYSETIQTITPEERNILFDIARSFNEKPVVEKKEYIPVEIPRNGDDLKPGEDFNDRGHIAEVLHAAGWSFVKEDSERIYFKRPGQSDAEHSGNWHKELRVFKTFSTSTEFDPDKAYKLFTVYAILIHASDFSKAAAQLRSEGYGTTPEPVELILPEYIEPERTNFVKKVFGFIKKLLTLAPSEPKAKNTTFPFHVLEPAMYDYIQRLVVDREYAAIASLHAAATAIGYSAILHDSKGYTIRPVFNICLIGRSADGKTPALRAGYFPVLDENERMILDSSLEISKKKKQADEQFKLKPAEREKISIPPLRQMIVRDITIEVLADILKTNPAGVALYTQELPTLLGSFGAYKQGRGGDEQKWMDLADFEPLHPQRKSDPNGVFVSLPIVSVIGGIQDKLAWQIYAKDKGVNGFAFRFLFVYPEDSDVPYLVFADIPDKVIIEYKNAFSKIIDGRGRLDANSYTYSEEARALLTKWHNRVVDVINRSTDDRVRSYLRKYHDRCRRYALLFQCIHDRLNGSSGFSIDGEKISIDSMRKAIDMTDYHIEMMYKTLETVDRTIPVERSTPAIAVDPDASWTDIFAALPSPFERSHIPGKMPNAVRAQISRWIGLKMVEEKVGKYYKLK